MARGPSYPPPRSPYEGPPSWFWILITVIIIGMVIYAKTRGN